MFYFVRGFGADDLVQMIAATVTSMVPQGLVLMATLAFTLGAVRMGRRGAVVQRLSAVESMASIDTLCMDKTGTLTTNRLHLERLVPVADDVSEEDVRARLRVFASASLDRSNQSLVALRAALGETAAELIDQLPFKSQNRYSAVRARAGGAEYVLALGAAEALQPFIPKEEFASCEAASAGLQATGLRLLLFAEPATIPREKFDGSLDGFTLRPLALIGLGDELRPEAAAVLRALADQGIAFKVISGDHPETVRATVAPLAGAAAPPALRALADGPVVSGAQLEAAADAADLIGRSSVFGRVSPWQKVEIVRALKARGRHVAMVGDGVNDVLPIKNADLGIAMGEGSRAAKTVAGLVLQTNDFGLLPQTLEEGRTILRNLRRAGKLFLVKNAYTLLLIVGALAVFRLPFPFLPQQVTLLNFLTIGTPALLITISRERSAAAFSAADFLREVGWFAVRTGVVIGTAGLLLMLVAVRVWHEDDQAVRTLLLSALVLLGLTTLLRALTHGETHALAGDRVFRRLAAAAVAVYLVAMYWGPAAYFFELTPLSARQWLWVLAFVVPAYLLLLLADRRRPKR
jgi:cation-transporting ATPase E